jgi:hypothetical protein
MEDWRRPSQSAYQLGCKSLQVLAGQPKKCKTYSSTLSKSYSIRPDSRSSAMPLPFQAGAALTTGLDPDSIIDRRSNPLLATQVAFRGLDGNMPQKELDLFQLPSRSMAEAGAGATQVVRRQFLQPNPFWPNPSRCARRLFRSCLLPGSAPSSSLDGRSYLG